MFEFDFHKCCGWTPNKPKFRIKFCNNGWHRFIKIIIPQKADIGSLYDYNIIEYQITYWNNYTNIFGKERLAQIVNDPSSE